MLLDLCCNCGDVVFTFDLGGWLRRELVWRFVLYVIGYRFAEICEDFILVSTNCCDSCITKKRRFNLGRDKLMTIWMAPKKQSALLSASNLERICAEWASEGETPREMKHSAYQGSQLTRKRIQVWCQLSRATTFVASELLEAPFAQLKQRFVKSPLLL